MNGAGGDALPPVAGAHTETPHLCEFAAKTIFKHGEGNSVNDMIATAGHSPMPASVQAVLSQLQGHRPMTGKELREATGLPRRTIYTALRKLRDLGLLGERQSLRDTRQTYFWVHEPTAAPA
jgi:hypothetical protein